MKDSIYLIDGESELVELSATSYDSEDLLQSLIAKHPHVLAGEQINPESPRRWVLVTREMGVPDEVEGGNRWSLDHLFLDQDAIPTLVEVKRSTDTRIRREVVGQMLDYAANAVVHWPIETIRAKFESNCDETGARSDDQIADLVQADIHDEAAIGKFWQQAKTNLQAGRVRLVFVADVIPGELRRIIEFLNGQMDPAEVIGVELKQYQDTAGTLRTLVPRVIGVTANAQRKKSTGTSGSQKIEITREQFFDTARMDATDSGFETIDAIVQWADKHQLPINWGRGAKSTTMIPLVALPNKDVYPISVWTNGFLTFQMRWLKNNPPFDRGSVREELAAKLESLPGWTVRDAGMEGYPFIEFNEIKSRADRQSLVEILDWMLLQLKNETS